MQDIQQWDQEGAERVYRGEDGGYAIIPRRNGYAVIPGAARGPRVPQASTQQRRRRAAKAARKRQRGAYNGQ